MSQPDYAERRPPAGLAAVVDRVWTRSLAGPRQDRILPDGCMDVMWTGRRLIVAGPDTRPYLTDSAPGRFVAVRFRPGIAPAFLGVPADALRNERVSLADVWPAWRVARLEERLDADAGVVAAWRTLLEELTSCGSERVDSLAPRVLQLARTSGDVAAMADRLGLSERQLRRRCLAGFGYGPKILHRVLRFRRAVGLARTGRPLADVAHETGYADQAHFAREVRALAGVPPRALLA